jgi:predicted DNA-binding transcriptional regulator YafY
MRRADRMIELVSRLKRDHLTTAEDLARELEVSVRTVYRDMASLQGQGMPIEGQAGLGYMLRGSVDLPPMNFDHDEFEALALGLAFVAEVGDPALIAAARTARSKIEITWEGGPNITVSDRRLSAHQRPERRAPASAAQLRKALRSRRLVSFRYSGVQGVETSRVVRPLALTAFSKGWFLVGWCILRAAFRIFRLHQMTNVLVLDEVFQDEPGRDLSSFLAQRNVSSRDPAYAAFLKGGHRKEIYAVCVDIAARRRTPFLRSASPLRKKVLQRPLLK